MLLKINNVATKLNCSSETIRLWYKWKERNPDNELAKILPDFVIVNRAKCWEEKDVFRLVEFMSKIPRGRSKSIHIKEK